jgi:hypothetical protein
MVYYRPKNGWNSPRCVDCWGAARGHVANSLKSQRRLEMGAKERENIDCLCFSPAPVFYI